MKDTEEIDAIQRFVVEMNNKFIERRERYKKLGWRDPEYKTIDDLTKHLIDEIREWREEYIIDKQMEELIDIANTSFMLWDRLRIDKLNEHVKNNKT